MRFSVIIPTYNPGEGWSDCVNALSVQSIKPDEVLVIDSSSIDESVALSVDAGFRVESIDKSQFNHGGTRSLALDKCTGCEFVVFLTQDAVLSGTDALKNILAKFVTNDVAAVCGRQLPRKAATLIEAHARLYNYPKDSNSKSIADKAAYGLKTAFISNSFAAYRVSALNKVGGFPHDVMFGEDMYVATKLLKSGYKIAYAADACVYHSHDYSLWQEMRRYFDMGVFHANEPWIREDLGAAEGEGIKFIVSEFKYLLRHAFWRIPEAILRTLFRYTGFRLGLIEARLPRWLKKHLAMNKGYFKDSVRSK